MPGKRYKSLARSSYGTGRSTDGAFDGEEYAAFFLGSWVKCRSTCVDEARYITEENMLEVVFKPSGTVCRYPMDEKMAHSFAHAPSKRGWIWDHVDLQGGDHYYVG